MKPVISRALNCGWEVPGSRSQHGTGRDRNKGQSAERREEQREKRITGQVEAIKERRAVNHGPAPASTQLRLQAKFGS